MRVVRQVKVRKRREKGERCRDMADENKDIKMSRMMETKGQRNWWRDRLQAVGLMLG